MISVISRFLRPYQQYGRALRLYLTGATTGAPRGLNALPLLL
jgi:hypothetical protein